MKQHEILKHPTDEESYHQQTDVMNSLKEAMMIEASKI